MQRIAVRDVGEVPLQLRVKHAMGFFIVAVDSSAYESTDTYMLEVKLNMEALVADRDELQRRLTPIRHAFKGTIIVDV